MRESLSDLDFKYPPSATLDEVNSVIVSVCSGTLVVMVACRCILSYILVPTTQVEKLISLLEIKHQKCVCLSFRCPLRPIKSIYPATADCTGSFLC